MPHLSLSPGGDGMGTVGIDRWFLYNCCRTKAEYGNIDSDHIQAGYMKIELMCTEYFITQLQKYYLLMILMVSLK